VNAIITYEDGTELEVEDFAPWAADTLDSNYATEEDLVALAHQVLDAVNEVYVIGLDDGTICERDEGYRLGWDSISSEDEEVSS
jgi:hypothetical protein